MLVSGRAAERRSGGRAERTRLAVSPAGRRRHSGAPRCPLPIVPRAPTARSLPRRAVGETPRLPRGLPRSPSSHRSGRAGVAKWGRSGGAPGRRARIPPSSLLLGWRSWPPSVLAHPRRPAPVAGTPESAPPPGRAAQTRGGVMMFAAGLVYCSVPGEASRTDPVPQRGSGQHLLPLRLSSVPCSECPRVCSEIARGCVCVE